MSKIAPYFLLSLLAWALFLPGISSLPVIDRDEAHFAQATRQMLQTGNFFQIRFQEVTRFQKPPGINWLQAASVKLFSNADASQIWPYRIPSVLAAWLSLLAFYCFSQRFFSRKIAFWASAFLGSSLLLVLEAHMAVIDASLLGSVILMQGALWWIYQKALEETKAHWTFALLFWLALSFGVVLKGVTPLVSGLTILSLCLFERRAAWLSGLRAYWGLPLFLALSFAWLYYVNEAEHSNYLAEMINRDLMPKLKGGHESHGKPPLFHLALLIFSFWPASLFLWQGFVYGYQHRKQAAVKFLLAWLLPTWLFFELMPTKLPQYVLPTFPVLALFCAAAIFSGQGREKPSRLLRILQVAWFIISLVFLVLLCGLPYFLHSSLAFSDYFVLALLSSILFLTTLFAFHGRYEKAAIGTILLAVLSYPYLFAAVLPKLPALWMPEKISQELKKFPISDTNPLLVVNYGEPSLVFYLNTKQLVYSELQTALKDLKAQPKRLLLIDENDYNGIVEKNWKIHSQIKGFNYSRGKWVSLLLIGQNKENKP